MQVTRWKCNRCSESGEAQIPDGTSVYDAVYMIEDAHMNAAPSCAFDLGKITVVLG